MKKNLINVAPKYLQLKKLILEEIPSYSLGELIPSETKLSKRWNVSKFTVIKALTDLVNEGILYRQQGKGTFVARKSIEEPLTKIKSFTEDMLRQCLKPGAKLLSKEIVFAGKEISHELGIAPGEEMVRIKRLRIANNEPVAIQTSHLIHRFCPGLLEEKLGNKSLTKILREKYNIRFAKAHQKIRTRPVSKEEAALLNISERIPVLVIERYSYLIDNKPIEYLNSVYRGDKYEFVVELLGET